MNFLCILIPAAVGLVCAMLGYLLGKLLFDRSIEMARLHIELETCKYEKENQLQINHTLKGDIEKWESKYKKLKSEFDGFKSNTGGTLPASVPFKAALAAKVYGKKITRDDLKIVEGIGPKIEELFHKAGIKTWKALAESSIEMCRKILDEGGGHFSIHEPATWPKQSEMAYLGKWEELKEWQDKMPAGRE